MSEKELPLGRRVGYPDRYDPGLLAAIPRRANREALGIADRPLPFHGADVWNVYELSWLNPRGKPQIAAGRFIVPCDSPNLVESKSLKLYLGSFNQERFGSSAEAGERMRADLSRLCGAEVEVHLMALEEFRRFLPEEPGGECLDALDIEVTQYECDPALLAPAPQGGTADEALYTELFRSRCPVTGQPDWATVTLCYQGPRIDRESLLRYLLSYRLHSDYHENCVERIFQDVSTRCAPQSLTVEANFLRRGGIDINPVRSTVEIASYEEFPRHVRQ